MMTQRHSEDITFSQAKERRDELEAAVARTDKALKALSGGGAFNLTPAKVRETPSWQKAKAEADAAFAALRAFNTVFVRRFRNEIREDRRSRYARGERRGRKS